MLTPTQALRLTALAAVLWFAATAYIRLWPAALIDPVMGPMGFVTTFPMAWLSIWLVLRLGGLTPRQLPAGAALVGGLAMVIDGAALRFAPQAYGTQETVLRLGAAWLLWGYGVSLIIALLWARRSAMIERSVAAA